MLHFKQHRELIQSSEHVLLTALLAPILLSLLFPIYTINLVVTAVQCLRYFKQYWTNKNLIIFDQRELQINPCITTSELLYKIFFVVPSASGFRIMYTITKHLATALPTAKHVWIKRCLIFLLNTVLGGSFWNVAASILTAHRLIQILQKYKKNQMFTKLRTQLVVTMYSELSLSIGYVAQLRIYKKHGSYVFNPKYDLAQALKQVTLVRCFSPSNIMHYGIALAPEHGKAIPAGIVTHTPLQNVISWPLDPTAQRISYFTSNAIFSGYFEKTTARSIPKYLQQQLTEQNIKWIYLKIALFEQLNNNGIVTRSPSGNLFIANTNRYNYMQQNAKNFSKQAVIFEHTIHEKLEQLSISQTSLLNEELRLIKNIGINSRTASLAELLNTIDLCELNLDDFLLN